MRSSFRFMTLGLAAGIASAGMSQAPYTWVVDGVVSGCTPGQQVTITFVDGLTQNILITENVTINPPDCSFGTVQYFTNNQPYVLLSVVTQCNGTLVGGNDSAFFNFLPDTAFTSMYLDCGGGDPVDCLGNLNGPDMPGTPCDDGNPATVNDIWSPSCICTGLDTNAVYDCLQIPNGPNVPGTWCVTLFGDTGIWSPDCICITNSNVDCEGVPNGPNGPGTMCVTLFGDTGTWSANCVCIPDSSVDCLGIPNGSNLPGTPCQAFGVVGTWSWDCQCVPNAPCYADFWVMQAWGPDSVPVPYELWIWNLSGGGNGVFTYLWDFGDGTTSTDPFPSHTYDTNGPYVLCLTIADNANCTSTHCDSISIDGDGMLSGMMGGGGDRQEGFTINVQNPLADAVQELSAGSIATWPNPAVDQLNVAVVSGMRGAVQVTVTDLEGRVVMSERASFSGDRNQINLSTSELGTGMYLLRISDGATNLSQRFVKSN